MRPPLIVTLLALLLCLVASAQTPDLGIFANNTSVGGKGATPGNAEFIPSTGNYRIVSGRGMRLSNNTTSTQFQYLWKHIAGDFEIAATVQILGTGYGDYTAGIMVRQTLNADAKHADFVIDGKGLPELHWRSRPGETSNTFNFPAERAETVRVRLARKGITFYLSMGKDDSSLRELAHIDVTFQDPVHVGLMASSDDLGASAIALFSDVELSTPTAALPAPK
jgi:TolB protein